MLFNSLAYVLFLTIVFAIYWLLKDQYRWILLLAASYFFYMCSGPQYGLLILGITVVSYLSSLIIESTENKRKRKLALVSTVAVSTLILIFFKYLNFISTFASSFFNIIGIKQDPVILDIVLPVGISFYTFQTMSYVIDVYRGTTKAEHHFGKYAAFVSFFPQLVAGPIERSNNLLPQIGKNHIFDYDKAIKGLKLMIWGYYKKLIIADVLSVYVEKVFKNPYDFKGFSLVLASVFFAMQIYCDFSGYSDIAIGSAKLFGIDLMTNFKSPYFSKSIKEFWSRWHISLSTWLRDYLYIPLGGNRKGKIRQYLNLMITFLVSGLWHGANWTFIMWGGVHGLAQVLENAVIGKKQTKYKFVNLLRTVLVFVFCVFAWVLFVSHSISDAIYVYINSFIGISSPVKYLADGISSIGLVPGKVIMTTVFVLIMAVYDYVSLKVDIPEYFASKKKVFQWIFYIIIGLIIVFFSGKGVASEFIYFQF